MELFQQLSSVALVFLLLGGLLWLARRQGKLNPFGALQAGRKLESVERLVLTPQHSLHLVRVGGQELLVATHPQGCTLLTESRASKAGAAA